MLSVSAAGKLLERYGHSLSLLLKSAYPQYSWQDWKWARSSVGFWDSILSSRSASDEFVKQFVKQLGDDLLIRNLDDWYRISRDDLKHSKGYTRLERFGGLTGILKRAYPNHPWDFKKMKAPDKKAGQRIAVVEVMNSTLPNQGPLK